MGAGKSFWKGLFFYLAGCLSVTAAGGAERRIDSYDHIWMQMGEGSRLLAATEHLNLSWSLTSTWRQGRETSVEIETSETTG